MTEQEWDKKLHIQTIGRDDSNADDHHHPYEPTSYPVLERLAQSGYISQKSILVDYGCGKGRTGFFLCHVTGCQVIGVEHDEQIWRQAMKNLENSGTVGKLHFFCRKAEDFEVQNADCFCFFNPFTVDILRAVLRRIIDSYYENPRPIRLFFYYPDDEYLSFLLTGGPDGLTDQIYFLDEIDCRDLFNGKDKQERIMVFETGEG